MIATLHIILIVIVYAIFDSQNNLIMDNRRFVPRKLWFGSTWWREEIFLEDSIPLINLLKASRFMLVKIIGLIIYNILKWFCRVPLSYLRGGWHFTKTISVIALISPITVTLSERYPFYSDGFYNNYLVWMLIVYSFIGSVFNYFYHIRGKK